MTITIGIKALNEETRIAATLRAALDAATPLDGTVVLADSGSADRTIEIARRLPVTVVQLADPSERSCGAGAQLAFQYVDREYFCLIDGDMILLPGFVTEGIAHLDAHPNVAGVGGHVIECLLETEEFEIRAAGMEREAHRRPGIVDRLDGGGIYRTSALRQVGYFSDRNLYSFEEFELATRLAAMGWKLARIDVAAIEHYGHTGNGYALLWQRLRSGQLDGAGQVLRAAFGQRRLLLVLRRLKHLRIAAVILVWWTLLMAGMLILPLSGAALVLAPIAFLVIRRRSLRLGIFSFCLWNMTAFGILRGIARPRTPATRPLASIEFNPLPASPA